MKNFISLPRLKKEQIKFINDKLKEGGYVLHYKRAGEKLFAFNKSVGKIECDFCEYPTQYEMKTKKEYKITQKDGQWYRVNNPTFKLEKIA